MKISVEQVGPCRKALRIEVPVEQVTAEYKKVLKDIATSARIPGFRPGKAPESVVEKQFTKDALDETRERLVPRAYHEALKQQGLTPVAVVDVGDIHIAKQLPLSFKVTVDLTPEFTLPATKGIALTSRKVEVKEEDIEHILTNMRERAAHFEPVTDRAAKKEDVVEIDYTGTCDGRPMGELAPDRTELAQGKEFWVLLSDNMPEFLPGIKAQLEGIAIGETRNLTITFPADYRVKPVAGKTATYTITARGIRERRSPELNDDFAKMVGQNETFDALKEALKKDVEERARADYDDEYFVKLLDKIKAGATIKYAAHTLNHEAEHVVDDLRQRLAQQGLDLETYYKMRNSDAAKFMEEEARPAAQKRLERSLIMDEVARQQNIQIDDAALDAEFNNTLMNLQMQGVNLNNIKGGKKGQQQIAEAVAIESANRVMTRRTLDRLKAIATGEFKAEEKTAEAESAELTEEAAVEEKPKKKAAAKTSKKEADASSSSEKKSAGKTAKSGASTQKTSAGKSSTKKTTSEKGERL